MCVHSCVLAMVRGPRTALSSWLSSALFKSKDLIQGEGRGEKRRQEEKCVRGGCFSYIYVVTGEGEPSGFWEYGDCCLCDTNRSHMRNLIYFKKILLIIIGRVHVPGCRFQDQDYIARLHIASTFTCRPQM